ncbi:NADH-FMN oxidoreductase RutF, flavin reductase (DIM6/NTAB) family [Roseivivax lentus]|uniref:NADH-FMN oxidoreductase RutF, flavin reductase (DIM6/NTAB) family n=1 Tax=Roseivivax lentus TaxID=633194 RepID=A0A1N7N295_9RHOB|nr:flavin reductase family protein [Roseivivax lentus]SIS92455.1 NADH-FMN oxidoreductase RutF, flavin reductase (DIM6/NTAB) family [Roseivivax lentus]
MNAPAPPFTRTRDPRDLRRSLSHFPTGVTVVTARGRGGAPIGVTVSSFNAVSLEPPLILWSLALSAASLAEFRAADFFAVNVLSDIQSDLPRIFSSPVAERFAGLDWREGIGGAPVLSDSAAVFECRAYARYDGGDHENILGEVLQHDRREAAPLVFAKGRLSTLQEPEG